MRLIDKNTKICVSFASNPGNFGNYFHNYLFDKLNLNYIYKSFKTDSIKLSLLSLRNLGIRGCGISMPFKTEALKYVDIMDKAVADIGSSNTVINEDGVLKAFNTDSYSIRKILIEEKLKKNLNILIRGSGGMANAIIYTLKKLGFNNLHILARNKKTLSKILKKWSLTEIKQIDLSSQKFDLLINATPLGMPNFTNEIPFEEEIIINSSIVMDVVVNPNGTKLSFLCKKNNIRLITGEMITKLQAKKQFELYTGHKLNKEIVEEAHKFYMLKSKIK